MCFLVLTLDGRDGDGLFVLQKWQADQEPATLKRIWDRLVKVIKGETGDSSFRTFSGDTTATPIVQKAKDPDRQARLKAELLSKRLTRGSESSNTQ